jgi:hypothetical protein
MSNHFSADNLNFPGGDRRLDLTDVFMFTSPDDPDETVLIMDSNPTSAPPPIPAPVTGPEFCPGAVYRINIDTDGDNQADVAFTFTFSEYEDGTQTGTAWYATGAQARQAEPAGEIIASDIPVSFDGTAQPVQAGRIRLCAGLLPRRPRPPPVPEKPAAAGRPGPGRPRVGGRRRAGRRGPDIAAGRQHLLRRPSRCRARLRRGRTPLGLAGSGRGQRAAGRRRLARDARPAPPARP